MICPKCAMGTCQWCLNTHRPAGEVELEGTIVHSPLTRELFVKRDQPATTWCDCQHKDYMGLDVEVAILDYRSETYAHWGAR